MTDIDRLIDAVEAGTFLMDVLPQHEATAYEAFSGSLDAAKRLHDALLPDVRCSIIIHECNKSRASIWRCLPRRWWQIVGPIEDLANETFADPARAWLLSILKAYRLKAYREGTQ